jgi:hypothetical protein
VLREVREVPMLSIRYIRRSCSAASRHQFPAKSIPGYMTGRARDLCIRARACGVVLVADGATLIVVEPWLSELAPETLLALRDHAGEVIAQLRGEHRARAIVCRRDRRSALRAPARRPGRDPRELSTDRRSALRAPARRPARPLFCPCLGGDPPVCPACGAGISGEYQCQAVHPFLDPAGDAPVSTQKETTRNVR